ncbi:MAG: formylglycine-generating enzyme family protein [Desulfobacca sp.]|uniref:formylglycine-generating enzyme family protein n=1 Tax=Desulfobacca sp. TaxID=2067990 RepID=UPI00404943E0
MLQRNLSRLVLAKNTSRCTCVPGDLQAVSGFFLLVCCLLFAKALLAAPPLPWPTVETNGLGLTLRLISGGTYLLGSPPEEVGRYWHEGPQHRVQLNPFYITDKEITNAQYGRFLAATGHPAPLYWQDKHLNGPDQPVVGVTWHDAVAFAAWLSNLTGQTYRLPTEAEWEAAARGGLVGQPFPWGQQPPDHDGRFLANFNPNPFDRDGYRYTAPVGSFPPNGFGLFDMAGNVAEWCLDWYDAKAYHNRPRLNPSGPPTGTTRVLRGGSWYSRARDLRCAARQFAPPNRTDGFIGFRLVRPITP